MNFSYIICYRHQPDRYQNLLKTINYLRDNFNLELILVEQDKESKIPDPSLFDQHIFTYSERPFNRSWAFNVGALNSKTHKVYFGDCDLICPKSQMDKSVELLNEKGCVSPYSKVVDLQPHESQKVNLESWEKISRTGRDGINLTGGIVGFRKDEFTKIAGWCEDFEGWGGEDDFQTWKVKNWLQWEEVPGNVYHLWHTRPQIDPKFYSKNLSILHSISKRNPQDVVNWINNSKNIIGNENKYHKPIDVEKPLIIMGNGPSLKDVNFEFIKNFDTFGLNAAYRKYDEINFYPKYFGCFDHVVTDSHKDNFQKLITDSPIEKFFFIKNYFKGEKFQYCNIIGTNYKSNPISDSFQNFHDQGNSGSNACQVGIMLGYKKIILLGVDQNYVEHVDGSTPGTGGTLVMNETPGENPNYWFDDYQQEGDVYNVPQLSTWQKQGWESLSKKAKKLNIDIVNCSPITSQTCFRKGELKNEIHIT